MDRRRDPVRLALRVIVFAAIFYGSGWFFFGPVLLLAGNLAGPTFAVLFSAWFATWLTLRIYENMPVFAMGFWWNRSSADNLLLGLAGGVGAAAVALGPALISGAAHIESLHAPDAGGLGLCPVLRSGGVGRRGTVLSRLRVSVAGGERRALGCHHPGWDRFRADAQLEPTCDLVWACQYSRFRHALWIRLVPEPRSLAADRTALRVERHAPGVRGGPERD